MILPSGVFNPALIDTVLAVPRVDCWLYAVPDCPPTNPGGEQRWLPSCCMASACLRSSV